MLVPHPIGQAYSSGEALPDPLPASPFPLFQRWFDEAHSGDVRASDRADGRALPTGLPPGAIAPNPNAMILATADASGRPASRVVLCKHIEPDAGYLIFYTNRDSRKGRAIADNPRVSVVFHWDALERQARIEGLAVPSPDDESDAYFRSRSLASRLGAWASRQSQPLATRQQLVDRLDEIAARFRVPPEALRQDRPDGQFDIPRPPDWGGYRIHADRLELWCGGPGRVHDRAAWSRHLEPSALGEPGAAGLWSSTRLYP